jgi:hypothetical protein
LCAIETNGELTCLRSAPSVKGNALQIQRDGSACLVGQDAELVCWGVGNLTWHPFEMHLEPNVNDSYALMFPLPAGKYTEVAVGFRNACARETETGKVRCYYGDDNDKWF